MKCDHHCKSKESMAAQRVLIAEVHSGIHRQALLAMQKQCRHVSLGWQKMPKKGMVELPAVMHICGRAMRCASRQPYRGLHGKTCSVNERRRSNAGLDAC